MLSYIYEEVIKLQKLKTFLAIILSIIALVDLIGFTACYTLKHYLNSETIKKTITDNDFSQVLDNNNGRFFKRT